MTDFYIPAACTITVFGQMHRFVRGIHPVPDIVANSHDANAAGIKPIEEMTDDEYRLLGMETPAQKAKREETEADLAKGQDAKVVAYDASAAPAKSDKAK